MRRRALLGAAAAALLLAGCAAAPPPAAEPPLLRLAPAALGRTLALQQQLSVSIGDRPAQRVEVLLEADAQSVRLALVTLGRTGARLEWDGRELSETRAPWWPDAVPGERVLSDLQLALWPAEAIRQALPGEWSLLERDGERALRHRGETVALVSYPAPDRTVLLHRRWGYRLDIESRALEVRP